MGEMTKVALKSDLPPGKATTVNLNGKTIALFNIKGSYYAIDNECTHAGGPLSEGQIQGSTVVCPWHGATFNVTSGEALSAPAFDGVKSYKTLVEGDEIKIEI